MKSKTVIKVKDMSPEFQKKYNDFFQMMVNAKSDDERRQIVEDKKKEAIAKLNVGQG